MEQIYQVLGMPLSVYCKEAFVIRNFIITDIHTAMPIPPYDHIVYAFEARCSLSDFQNFDSLNKEGKIFTFGPPTEFYVLVGDKIPFYIDSYETRVYPNNINDIGSPMNQEVIISGHFDSRDFEDGYNSTKKRCQKKKPEPIHSRFEILDL